MIGLFKMLNEKRSMTASKEGRELSKYLMHCKVGLFIYRIYSHPSVSVTDWFPKPQRIPRSAEAQVPYSQLAPPYLWVLHPPIQRADCISQRGLQNFRTRAGSLEMCTHRFPHAGHLRGSPSAHTRLAECPHPLWLCVPQVFAGCPDMKSS